jgi:hypothetical protein
LLDFCGGDRAEAWRQLEETRFLAEDTRITVSAAGKSWRRF